MNRLARSLALGAAAVPLLAGCSSKGGIQQDKVVTLVERGVITETKARPPLSLIAGREYIWVNGIRYRISGANIMICGADRRSPEELRPGMVVRVRGYLDRTSHGGHATEIEF